MSNYPEQIKITGLPFSYFGLNEIYYRNDKIDYIWHSFGSPPTYVGSFKDPPSYYIQSYFKWGIIPIPTVEILYINDHWELRIFRTGEIICSNNTLEGKWNFGEMEILFV